MYVCLVTWTMTGCPTVADGLDRDLARLQRRLRPDGARGVQGAPLKELYRSGTSKSSEVPIVDDRD